MLNAGNATATIVEFSGVSAAPIAADARILPVPGVLRVPGVPEVLTRSAREW
jgi:hypothetical protein